MAVDHNPLAEEKAVAAGCFQWLGWENWLDYICISLWRVYIFFSLTVCLVHGMSQSFASHFISPNFVEWFYYWLFRPNKTLFAVVQLGLHSMLVCLSKWFLWTTSRQLVFSNCLGTGSSVGWLVLLELLLIGLLSLHALGCVSVSSFLCSWNCLQMRQYPK